MRGEIPDKTPFTIYECMIPPCAVERELRNAGLCVVERRVGVVATHTPNVRHRSRNFTRDGAGHVEHVTETPLGELTSVERPAGFTSWHIEHMFKGPEDYKRLLFIIGDRRYETRYENHVRAQERWGGDAILRAGIGLTPLHEIMVHWMGLEMFAIEWDERRDEIEKLCNAMAAKHSELYPLIARSPAGHANYGGNEVPEVMGLERLRKFVIPLWNEAAAVFHEHGKQIGSHLDGNNRLWAKDVAESGLDYVEAFTPSPDTDMTLSDALAAWPGKFLWINFPSSVHLRSIEEIERTTRELIEAARPGNRFIMGITEDIPEDRWQGNLQAISRAVNE